MNDIPWLSPVIFMFGPISLPRISHNIVDEKVNYIYGKEIQLNLTCNFNLLKTITILKIDAYALKIGDHIKSSMSILYVLILRLGFQFRISKPKFQ